MKRIKINIDIKLVDFLDLNRIFIIPPDLTVEEYIQDLYNAMKILKKIKKQQPHTKMIDVKLLLEDINKKLGELIPIYDEIPDYDDGEIEIYY